MITTEDLIKNIKSRTLLPTSQNTIADSDLLNRLNEELQQYLVPMVKSAHEEYLVVEEDLAIVPGQDAYKIPTRALGAAIKGLQIIRADNTTYTVRRISREESLNYQLTGDKVFYFQGPNIRLCPSPTEAETLRVAYVRRPNTLVSSSNTVLVNAVQDLQLTLAAAPVWLNISSKYDVIDHDYPSELKLLSVTPVSTSGNKATFASVGDVAVGDYLAPVGTTSLFPLPEELAPLLEERVVLRIWQTLGDDAGVATAMKSINEMEHSMGLVIDHRAEEAPVIGINHSSPGRTRRYR